MFSSRRSKLSNADSMEGESLFDFLRRKKRVSLQDSINKSIHKESIDMSFSNYHIKEVEPQQIIETTRNQTSRKNAKSSITPKKVTFAEPEQKKLANTARTFIDMISPLKSQKTKVAQKIPIDDQEEQKQQTSSKSGKKKTVQKQFTRRQLNKSIQTMKQTLLNLLKAGKKLKQKSHSLFIDMKPVFKIAEQNQNKIIRRKVEQAKEKLRVMEHCLDQFDVQGGNQIIQSFHRTLSDHLISIQAKNRSTYQKVQIENFNKMRVEKDSKIHQLVNENKDLTQNLNNLQRKIQKLEAALEDTKQKQSQKLQNYQQINQEKLQRISQNLDELKKQNTSLKEKISQLDKQKIQFSKKIKDAVYTKQATQKRLMEQNQKAKSARQEFLLNEIMMLKQQFQRDMTQLTGLYASKQQDHIAVIEDLKRQLQQLRQFNEVNKQNQKKVINQSQAMRSVVNKYRKQNQCLVTDMHRMNEELYQHWLALKDIKTLATRLQLMSRFSRIYQDLAFNEHLFS